MLADIETLERRIVNVTKKSRGGDHDAKIELNAIDKVQKHLGDGLPAKSLKGLTDEENACFRNLQLLTAKPIVYVCNVSEDDVKDGNDFSKKIIDKAADEKAAHVIVSARIEEEIAQLDSDDKVEFLFDLGLDESGLARLIRAGYNLLDLLTFFTAGPRGTCMDNCQRGYGVRSGGRHTYRFPARIHPC